jgi:hypothetical protein
VSIQFPHGERRQVRLAFLGIDGSGALVRLQANSALIVSGSTDIAGFVEVLWDGRTIRVFETDLRDRSLVVDAQGTNSV